MATDTPTAPDKTATAAEPPKTEPPKTSDGPAAATPAAGSQTHERTTAPPAEPKPASPPKRARAKTKPRPRRAAASKSAATKRTAATKRQTKPEPPRTTGPRHTARPTSTSAPARNRNRAVALSVIDAQERSAHALVDYQLRAAELSRIPGAATLVTAQADLLRSATGTYVAAARELLK